MKVLIGCEFSGAVRRAFRAVGHEAWSCDLLPAEDESPYHIQGDLLGILTDGWDMAIFHPPCTYLSASGMHRTTRGLRPARLTEEALDFVRDLLAAPIPRIALENPVGVISARIRPPDQYVQPWMFGDDASKKTGLWLKDLPALKPTGLIPPRLVCCGRTLPPGDKYGCPNCNGEGRALPRWGNQTDSGQNRLTPSKTRAADRAKTYQGIAKAMAEQWGDQ